MDLGDGLVDRDEVLVWGWRGDVVDVRLRGEGEDGSNGLAILSGLAGWND